MSVVVFRKKHSVLNAYAGLAFIFPLRPSSFGFDLDVGALVTTVTGCPIRSSAITTIRVQETARQTTSTQNARLWTGVIIKINFRMISSVYHQIN